MHYHCHKRMDNMTKFFFYLQVKVQLPGGVSHPSEEAERSDTAIAVRVELLMLLFTSAAQKSHKKSW